MSATSEPGHLHFVQSLEPLQGGGLGAAALQLHAALRAANLQSELLTTRSRSFGVTFPGVQQFARFGPQKLFYAPGMAASGGSLFSDDRPLIVHGHGFYVYPNFAIGRMARRRGVPLVYHPHGMFEPWILRRSLAKKRLVHWLFEGANFRHARLWRALSPKEADQIRAVVGRNAKIVVAPNGVELPPFGVVATPEKREKRRAVFIGRLHPKKGLDLLLSSWAHVGAQRTGWELIIAGPDEAGYGCEVKRIASDLDLDEAVKFVGTVTGEDKLRLLSTADLFVLTSYSEGLPMAVLEAMASRVPVLITKACNLPEVSAVGAGWACEATAEEVVFTLKQAIQASDVERTQRGQVARMLIEKSFDWAKICAELHAACKAACF